jgi:predicted histone-like DNA-binding protein
MTIYYKPVKVSEPGVKSGKHKYYARVSSRNKINLTGISERIARKCTLNRADIYAALEALVEELPDLLLHNYNVELGGLGTFSLYIQSDASDSPEKVNTKNIKGTKIGFRAGTEIKIKLKNARFKKLAEQRNK